MNSGHILNTIGILFSICETTIFFKNFTERTKNRKYDGMYFFLSPALKIGIVLAFFKLSGKIPCSRLLVQTFNMTGPSK